MRANNRIERYIHLFEDLHADRTAVNQDKIRQINQKIDSFLVHAFSTQHVKPDEFAKLLELRKEISCFNKTQKSHKLAELESKISRLLENQIYASEFAVNQKYVQRIKNKLKPILFDNRFLKALSDKIAAQFYDQYKQKLIYQKATKSLGDAQVRLNKLFIKKNALIHQGADRNHKKIEQISQDIERLQTKVEAQNNIIRVHRENREVAARTRRQFVAVGGTNLELKTSDDVRIQGVYLSADEFRKKIHEHGGRPCSLALSGKVEVRGLMFPGDGASFLETLDQLKAFSSSKGGAGLTQIHLPDNRVLVVPDDHIEELLKHGVVVKDPHAPKDASHRYILQEQAEGETTISISPLDTAPLSAGGTVVLAGGTKAVYEMQKKEALAFLLRGMNVMMVNYRGFGESEGTPNEKGTYRDLEAAYQYLKQVQHVEDKKILVKGLCLSGGITAQLAKRHPDINLFLDQTYADIHNVSKRQVSLEVKKTLKLKEQERSIAKKCAHRMLTEVISAALKLIEPHYNVKDHLPHVKGRILIMESRRDTFTPIGESEQMVQRLSKEKKLHNVTMASIPGAHAALWVDAKEHLDHTGEAFPAPTASTKTYYTGRAQIDHFLESAALKADHFLF